MKRGELEHLLTRTNPWWRTQTGRPWHETDLDLKQADAASFSYVPSPLLDLEAGGLYELFGPRRAGKSVELKRLVKRLLDQSVEPRHVVHAACDTLRVEDLPIMLDLLDSLAPPDEGARYVLLDEITAISGDWVSHIKWLRDNTSLRDDCVVVSGSSADRLEDARKAFAGRRGPATDSDRYLLQMSFRAYCGATGLQLPELPTIHPSELLGREAGDAINDLRPYLNDLVPAWERYLEVGGFPQAVDDWNNDRQVSDSFMQTLWAIVHGDALRGDWAAAQTQQLLELLSSRLANPLVNANIAHQLDIHTDTLKLRLGRLARNFIAWPCFKNNRRGRPDLSARRKVYFLDPLYARLATHRSGHAPPDYTELSEQQIGVHLLRAHEAESRGTLSDFDNVLYEVPRRAEIDFTGAWLDGIPIEGKYVEGSNWHQDTLTAMAAYGRCVLSTRTLIDRDGDRIAIPAAMIALLIDPTPASAATRRSYPQAERIDQGP